MKISFVIPCYRSALTLPNVIKEIKSVVAQRPDVAYEIVMVSDHSPDNVYEVIEKMCAEDSAHLVGFELARNFGQHSALMAGYAASTGDIIFSLDDDGQAPVDAVFALVDKIEKDGVDIAMGSYPEKKHNIFRNMGSKVNDLMMDWLLGKPRKLQSTSFFAMRRFVVNEMLKYNGPYPFLEGLMFRVTKNIVNVMVNHRERESGSSGYTFSKLLGLWLNGFTAFSVKPLRLASWAGFLCATLGFIYGAWTIIRKLFIDPVTPMGYNSLMAVLLFIGGMLMLILGLVGEYIGRIYICLNNSPQYVISKRTFSGDKGNNGLSGLN